MAAAPAHLVVAADAYRVPRPFRSLAVRGDEPGREDLARAPWAQLQRLRTDFLDAAARRRLVGAGRAAVQAEAFGDVRHALTSLQALDATVGLRGGWGDALGAALCATGVLGDDGRRYRDCLLRRIDFLACRGAGFHNDVRGHWPRCLFWILVLDADDVELVMPHAGVHLPLAPGDLVVFDPALAHGLCRPADRGQALAASFEGGAQGPQLFLTGELPLTDAQWAALGAPWLPVEAHHARGALDLRVAEFDERSGAIQRPLALRDAMTRAGPGRSVDRR